MHDRLEPAFGQLPGQFVDGNGIKRIVHLAHHHGDGVGGLGGQNLVDAADVAKLAGGGKDRLALVIGNRAIGAIGPRHGRDGNPGEGGDILGGDFFHAALVTASFGRAKHFHHQGGKSSSGEHI